jgi:hypothetical protein
MKPRTGGIAGHAPCSLSPGMRAQYWKGLSTASTLAFIAACTSHTGSSPPADRTPDASVEAGSNGSGTGGSTSSAPGQAGSPPVIFIDAGSGRPTNGADGSAVCAAEVHEAEALKLDLLVLMDGSGSMKDDVDGGRRKWDLLVDALHEFVDAPESAGIGVGLTYFGIPAGYDAGDLVVSCNVPDYETPAVAIRDLPANATALIGSLSNYTPVGGTPTRPALAGAEAYAGTWLTNHPTHRVVIVLATDGIPNDCDSTVDAVAAIASDGAQMTPPIAVYVIGVGTSLMSLGQVAVAGGTDHAYVVDPSSDATASFLAAMNTIRGRAALPCEYQLPQPSHGALDLDKVNVAFTGSGNGNGDGGAAKKVLLQVRDADGCSAPDAGWYYDDPASPKSVELCPTACNSAKTDLAGRIDVLVGCKTQSVITR